MSLWLERYNELDRYHSFRREAEEHRLASQGRVGREKKEHGMFQSIAVLFERMHCRLNRKQVYWQWLIDVKELKYYFWHESIKKA